MKRTALLVVAAFAAAAAVVVTAGATPSATPGVTARTILLEGTFPLSGPASGYAPIPAAMEAYFSYVNAQHGVNGRQIIFKFDDDGYNPREHRSADAQVRRAGSRVRAGRRARHGAAAGGRGVPEPAEGSAALRLDGRHDVRPRLREVPVDDRLAAGLRGRRRDLRQVHRQEPAGREARHHLPERRLRRQLPERPQGRPRVAHVADRLGASRST